MKTMKYIIACVIALLMVSCNHDEESVYNPAVEGKLRFEFVRNNVYMISSLDEIRTVKVLLQDQNGKDIELPSLEVEGNENLLYTPYVTLPAGVYYVTGYRCFDLQADLIEDLDIQLSRDNDVEVIAGEENGFSLPVHVKQVLTTSNLYNTLRGICLEILGDNEDTWPKSWDFESGEISIEWAGLEFDTDENSNPTDVIGLVISGEPEYIIDSDTGEKRLVSLPEFKHMVSLPACVSNLTKLQSIVVRNCDMEDIPAELANSEITSLTVENTNLAVLPDDLGEMKALTDVSFSNNKMTEFPECLTHVESMEIFTIDNERISQVPASIANWGQKLVALSIRNTEIESIPDVFDRLWHVSTLDFSGNSKLSTLPPTIGMERIPYDDNGNYSQSGITGIDLSDCSFTAIPQQVQRSGIRSLRMARNQITHIDKEQLDRMTDLETLVLDGNKLSSFPALTNPRLSMLSLIGTGLTRDQVDLSGMPNLNPRYVFFTQQEYDAVFGW